MSSTPSDPQKRPPSWEFEATISEPEPFDETIAVPDQLLGGAKSNLARLGDDLRGDLQDSLSFPRYEEPLFLDEGGMGQVYQATDPRIRRTVAIKSLRQTVSQKPSIQGRFLREAQLNSRLTHPNIVPIYDLSRTPDEKPFFVMKLLEGQTLSDAIVERKETCIQTGVPLDGTPLLLNFVKVCEAIAFAHSLNILHRDLKPSNIMLGSHGEVWVMDWGLAKDLRAKKTHPAEETDGKVVETDDSRSFSQSDLTQVGSIVGTPAYMSPEQANGLPEALDVRSDVHSLGAMLYHILTLEAPYRSERTSGILTRVREGLLDLPREAYSDVNIPRDLEAITLKAMAFRQEDRYPDANALREDLTAFLERRPISATTYSTLEQLGFWLRKHRAACTTFLVAGLTTLLALGGISWQRQKENLSHFETSLHSARDLTHWNPTFDHLLTPPQRVDPKTGLASPSSPETTEQRADKLREHLAAASLLEQALPLFPQHPQARNLRLDIGRRIIRMSLAGNDLTLARFETEQLQSHGMPTQELDSWKKRIADARENTDDWIQERLATILSDLDRGLHRPSRPPGAPYLDDYLDEVASYPKPLLQTHLLPAFSPLIEQARIQGSDQIWTTGQRDRVRWLCRTLGRFTHPDVVRVFAQWAEVLRDEALLVEVGIALCRTRQRTAFKPLMKIRHKLHFHPASWSRIKRWLNRIPMSAENADSHSSLSPHLLAPLLREQGNFSDALVQCNAALERDPSNISIRLLRAECLAELKRYPEALDIYNTILAATPNNLEGLWRRTELYRRLYNYPAALKDAQRAVKIEPESAAYQYNLGLVYLNMKENRLALNQFNKAIQISPHDPEYFVHRGWILRDSGQVTKAFNDFNKALKLDPENANAFSQRALAYEITRQFEQALADHTRAIRLAPGDAKYHSNRGNLHQTQKHFSAAWADFTRAIELDSNLYQPLYNRGNISYSRKEFGKALEDYNRAIEIFPNHAEALTNRGLCYRSLGQTDEALASYTRAIEANPRLPNPLYNRAIIHLEQSRPRKALDDLDQYLQLAPTSSYHARARYHRGRAHRVLGNHPLAVKDFRYYLQKIPQALERKKLESYLREQQKR